MCACAGMSNGSPSRSDETLAGTCSLLRGRQCAESAVRHTVLDGQDECQAAMRSHGEASAERSDCPQRRALLPTACSLAVANDRSNSCSCVGDAVTATE